MALALSPRLSADAVGETALDPMGFFATIALFCPSDGVFSNAASVTAGEFDRYDDGCASCFGTIHAKYA
jgi:hypothetical protein